MFRNKIPAAGVLRRAMRRFENNSGKPPIFDVAANRVVCRTTREMYQETMNLYNVYFGCKGTGPRTVQIEAQNSAGVKAQVEARYPGAYNITLNQLLTSAKKKRE